MTSSHAGDGVKAGVFLWLACVLSVVVCLVVLVALGVPAMCRVAGGGGAVVAFLLSLFLVLPLVLVALPVDRASAAPVDLGPDGYFSTLGAGALPVASGNWASTRRIVFGKQGSAGTYGGATVSGGYKTLAKGAVASVPDADFGQNQAWTKSATTSVAANEALLWADDTVTSGISFDANYPPSNSFDSAAGAYRSNLALVSDAVGAVNYSSFEQSLLRAAPVEGVCTAAQPVGCGSGSYTQQSDSVNAYQVFPLSIGDVNKYFNHTSGGASDANLACPTGSCANGIFAFWLRSAHWYYTNIAFTVLSGGSTSDDTTFFTSSGLRPAVRLGLEQLVLSADSGDQGQNTSGDLRLTYVEPGKQLHTWSASVSGAAGSRALSLSGSSDLGSDMGWKVVDPATNMVLGSGRTSAGGNMALPESLMPDVSKDYDLYVWGQQDGSATTGLTNRATEPVKTTIKGWKVKTPPSYGIDVTGTTSGGLKAYKIGDYTDTVFDHTGALGSVKLTTPAGLVSVLLAAAGVAGGVGVDAGNPIGWVASHWLGYPTSPLSDDVTSAFSPYAGSLQLFARALAGDTASLGPVAGSLPAGTFSSLSTVVLPVSGPGLYLVVDDSQASGGSLPIIVGTRVFNPVLDGGDGRMVDFADAGVKGKPRLGRASLKTSITDVAKRVVNDAGMDGFDLGAAVEYEIALQVPDLSSFASLPYSSYVFDLTDVADPGLTLPAVSGVRVLMDVPSPGTDVTGTAGLSVGVSGDTLSVSGLKAVFAEDVSGRVANKASVPVGSLIRIRYAAVLNTGASLSAPGGGGLHPNVNTATLTRSRVAGVSSGWDDAGPGVESRSAVANAYVFGLDLVKVDKDDTTRVLGGAGFEVTRDGQPLGFVQLAPGVYRLAVPGDAGALSEVFSHTDGTLSLQGVEARALSLRESTAPSGYFKVPAFMVEVLPVWNTDASEVTLASYRAHGTSLAFVSQDGRAVMVADPAHSLANLPYTGGVGILILLVLAILFLVFAVRPYYLSHRAETTANILS
ncbi:isopeptide-forming domain-containing fimbrial protein [Bifidobacterium psychraerophilum]|uniref:isopeptide-forming domain-containing fimbrial protein n=3 Tax=Bifidobacterium psychraerophilum TaxID=218140 RepID=UPI0013BEA548|nr:isopeptide-forming domain-containing fimbrial protein [Bifidobacterium psychraerophilum]